MKVWIINFINDNITLAADSANVAYRICVKYIKCNLSFESEYDMDLCLKDLTTSYLNDKSQFEVNNILTVKSFKIIEEVI